MRQTPSAKQRASRQRGFTLIEAGTAILILATMATLAIPGFQQLLQRRQVQGVADELASDLQFQRTEAVARNRSLRASFFTFDNGASCYLLHSGPAAACRCETDGRSACAGDGAALKTVFLPPGNWVSLQPKVRSIVYDPTYGTSTPAGTLHVTGRDGRAIHHTVNILGRLRSCSPDGAFTGYRAC